MSDKCPACGEQRKVSLQRQLAAAQAERDALKADNERLRACHEAELGVCGQHCDVVQRLRAVIRDTLATLPPVGGQDWWCPTCKVAIACATNDERCPHCGTYLGDCQADDWNTALRAKLEAAIADVLNEQANVPH